MIEIVCLLFDICLFKVISYKDFKFLTNWNEKILDGYHLRVQKKHDTKSRFFAKSKYESIILFN